MPASIIVNLNTGATMPTVGLGTWKAEPNKAEHAVEFAIKNGYRHIDTAAQYGNEADVGKGIKNSGVPREQIFLTTKLDNPDHGNEVEALETSLKKLDTPYIDLWLMHWPAPLKDGKVDESRDWLDTWKAMEDIFLAHPERVKAIGVSNFSVKYLERLLPVARIVPAVNQIEIHPSCPQADIVGFCQARGIILTAYSPQGSDDSPLRENDVVKRISHNHYVQPANILISFAANISGTAVIPKSVHESRIVNNLKTVDLSGAEIQALFEIHKTGSFRVANPVKMGWGSLGFPDLE